MSIYQTTEYDTENEFDWTSIQYTIEDDVIIATRTLFDAGYQVFGTYESGVLVEEFYVDTLDALGFQNRFVTYDAAGQITARGTVYPEDLRVTENFENGVRTETVLQDGFFGDGAKPWQQIAFAHDAAGNIAERRTTLDDGRVEVETFEKGVRETRQDFAQTKHWETIDTSFDATGALASRTTTYDSGLVKEETFEAGQRVQIVQTDSQGNGGLGTKSWTSIVNTYDAEGELAARVVDYDNGVLKTEGFAGGQRESMLQQDLEDAKNWETITTEYDAGQIAQRTVAFDSGDVSLSLYAEGTRTQLLQLDGDDSASWLLRVTDFDGDGGREVTRYASVEEIPEELLGFFPDLVPPVETTEYVLDFNQTARFGYGDTVLDGAFMLSVGSGRDGLEGALATNEYGGATPDADLEAFNAWGATIGFSKSDGDTFEFSSVSLANAARSDTTYVPEENWANTVTINGYRDDVLVASAEIDLTFDHVTHELGWDDLDRVDFMPTGGGITDEYVENAGWFSMDDVVFIA